MRLIPRTLGLVGSEAAKFTPETEERARDIIRAYLQLGWDRVVSGACHLGGIDVWAIEEAKEMGIATQEFSPQTQSWNTGYKPRNIQIAAASHTVVCVTVKTWPPDYKGMRFGYCYHCKTAKHVKSGGCWTVNYARQIGKRGYVVVVE
jgi:hypothetical protein